MQHLQFIYLSSCWEPLRYFFTTALSFTWSNPTGSKCPRLDNCLGLPLRALQTKIINFSYILSKRILQASLIFSPAKGFDQWLENDETNCIQIEWWYIWVKLTYIILTGGHFCECFCALAFLAIALQLLHSFYCLLRSSSVPWKSSFAPSSDVWQGQPLLFCPFLLYLCRSLWRFNRTNFLSWDCQLSCSSDSQN